MIRRLLEAYAVAHADEQASANVRSRTRRSLIRQYLGRFLSGPLASREMLLIRRGCYACAVLRQACQRPTNARPRCGYWRT